MGKDDLAIKTGRGGLMDAEFVAQALVPRAWLAPSRTRSVRSQRARDAGILPDAGPHCWKPTGAFRRVEGILRRWSYEGETCLAGRSGAVLPRRGALRLRHAGGVQERAGQMAPDDPGGL
jgi:hypothetical protein